MQNDSHKRRTGHGHRQAARFTLVELLTVVAMLSVLLVLILPAVSSVRLASVRAACQANLHGIGVATMTYSVDYRFALPTYYADPALAFDTFRMCRDTGARVNLGGLLDYADNPRMFYCPGQDASTAPSIAYDTPENRWADHSGSSPQLSAPRRGLNSSFTARFRNSGSPTSPRWSMPNYSNKVIYSDFIGVDAWPGRGRFQRQICSPHRSRGYNRLFGDGSVLWARAESVSVTRPVNGQEPRAEDLEQYYLLLDVLRE